MMKNYENLIKLPEVIELKDILIPLGYKPICFSDGKNNSVISFRLVKGFTVLEIKASERINMRVFTMGSREQIENNHAEIEELDNACEIAGIIAGKYGYWLNNEGTVYGKRWSNNENEVRGTYFRKDIEDLGEFRFVFSETPKEELKEGTDKYFVECFWNPENYGLSDHLVGYYVSDINEAIKEYKNDMSYFIEGARISCECRIESGHDEEGVYESILCNYFDYNYEEDDEIFGVTDADCFFNEIYDDLVVYHRKNKKWMKDLDEMDEETLDELMDKLNDETVNISFKILDNKLICWLDKNSKKIAERTYTTEVVKELEEERNRVFGGYTI